MLWIDKLNEWDKGIPQKYPIYIKNRFFYETSVINKKMDNIYKEKFIENSILDKLNENYYSFTSYINSSKNKYVSIFYNLSRDSVMIIPIPKENKNFTTIKDFIDNASITHQKMFWKIVVITIKKILKENDKIYVSTHGLGIPYFHLRLDKVPKYYQTKSFI